MAITDRAIMSEARTEDLAPKEITLVSAFYSPRSPQLAVRRDVRDMSDNVRAAIECQRRFPLLVPIRRREKGKELAPITFAIHELLPVARTLRTEGMKCWCEDPGQ
jgi:hypothetical protein